jgi:hypothetical protein
MDEFDNGAKRSSTKLAFHTIPPGAIRALAERATLGLKYGEFNYMKGGEDFFKQAKNHLYTHWTNYMDGILDDEKELTDHLKAIMWNAAYLLWYEEEQKKKTPSIGSFSP